MLPFDKTVLASLVSMHLEIVLLVLIELWPEKDQIDRAMAGRLCYAASKVLH